jgi:hypothetical protein
MEALGIVGMEATGSASTEIPDVNTTKEDAVSCSPY